MSQPSIPNITPIISVTKQETIALLLSSIAMNELSIAHILNAEGEKIQSFVKYANDSACVKTKDYIQFNESVSRLLEDVNMEQWLGLNKMDRIISLIDDHYTCNCVSEQNCEEYEECEEYEDPCEDEIDE